MTETRWKLKTMLEHLWRNMSNLPVYKYKHKYNYDGFKYYYNH